MPLLIDAIAEDGLADEYGLRPGDTIISINDHFISDFIDLQFFGSDEELEFLIAKPNGKKIRIKIFQDWTIPLGITPKAHNCISCINNCIFCFVDQIQPGFRNTLYIKDDDYRLSFAYGNFITLTNLTNTHFKKIFQQKLSPLYVSVHTTDPQLHKKMLQYSIEFNILDRLQELCKNNIKLHTQIVVIPQWNDKDNLKRTLDDIDALGENILSIGVVPIGLTKTRNSLTPLRTVTPEEAQEILIQTEAYDRTYCADELFMLAERQIPESEYYDEYPQLENGIGMLRLLLENWKFNKKDFIEFLRDIKEKIVFITGISAFPVINGLVNDINDILPGKVRIVEIINNNFGTTVTVAGLLTATDIREQVQLADNEIIAVSSNLFNDDDMTLDNISEDEFRSYFNNKLIIVDEEFADWKLI